MSANSLRYKKRQEYENKKSKKDQDKGQRKSNEKAERIGKIIKKSVKKASVSLILDKEEETFVVASLIVLDHIDKILAKTNDNDSFSSTVKSYLQDILNIKDDIDDVDNDNDNLKHDNDSESEDEDDDEDDDEEDDDDDDEDDGDDNNVFSKMANTLANSNTAEDSSDDDTNIPALGELKLSEPKENHLKIILDAIKALPRKDTEKIIKAFIRNDRYQSRIEMRKKEEERRLRYSVSSQVDKGKKPVEKVDVPTGLPMHYQIPADLPPKVRVHLSCDSGKPNANKEKLIVFDRVDGIAGLLAAARDKFNVGKKYEYLVLKSKEILSASDIATTKGDLYLTLTSKLETAEGAEVVTQSTTKHENKITKISPDISNDISDTKAKPVASASTASIESAPLIPIKDSYEIASPRKVDSVVSQQMFASWEEYLRNPKNTKMIDSQKSLPIFDVKKDLLHTINTNKITVVSGETGSGKTTQLPAYLLEDLILNKKGSEAYIICTQPRRIAAISVAERVASELGEQVGETVGYQVRLNSRVSPKTRIIYCTTGVLLRKLQVPNFLDLCSHIVVDEVHERQVETDFLMALLNKNAHNYPHLRLIMMSATMQEENFSNYFKCPIVYVSGRTYPVEQNYLEDIFKLVASGQADIALSRGFTPPSQSKKDKVNKKGKDFSMKTWVNDTKKMLEFTRQEPGKTPPKSNAGEASRASFKLPKFDADAVAEIVIRIIQKFSKKNDRANTVKSSDSRVEDRGDCVLVFLSGIQAIDKVSIALRRRNLESLNAYVLSLHGSLPPEHQKRVFRPTKPNEWKIVLSTNIAETSVTIDDVTHVVDVGTHKEMRYDPTGNISSLQEVVISKAGARQRAGRAGRVRKGHCWRIYSEQFHNIGMDEFPVPEIKRVPLEEVVLQILLLQLGMPEEFLGLCLEPPSFSHIKAAVKALLDIKAILPHPQLPLTPLGVHLARMPVDCRIGKMLITSCLLGCVEPSLTIAAALGGKSPFVSPMNAREESRNAHKSFVGYDKFSDHLAIVNAFDSWLKIRNSQGKGAAFAYCNQKFLSMTVLEEILLLRKDFKSYLIDAGFIDDKGIQRLFDASNNNHGSSDSDDDDIKIDTNSQNLSVHLQHQLMRCTIFAGLYPQMGRVTQYTDKDQPRGKGRQDMLPIHILQMDGTEVFIHPSSLNSNKLNSLMETKTGKAREAYLVFNKLVASGVSNTKVNPNDKSNATSSPAGGNNGRPYIYDCTSVPLPGNNTNSFINSYTNDTIYYKLAILLFGGDVSINADRDMMVVKDPNSKLETSVIKVKSSELHAVLFKRLQNEIENILKMKIENTKTDISMRQSLLVSVLEKLLERYT